MFRDGPGEVITHISACHNCGEFEPAFADLGRHVRVRLAISVPPSLPPLPRQSYPPTPGTGAHSHPRQQLPHLPPLVVGILTQTDEPSYPTLPRSTSQPSRPQPYTTLRRPMRTSGPLSSSRRLKLLVDHPKAGAFSSFRKEW
jgi:hypothetical protein